MTYTFLHRGIVMGESDLATKSGKRRQRAGSFQPTAYGRTLLPRVTCVLSVGLALKAELHAIKATPKHLRDEKIDQVFGHSEAGRAMIDVGRVLSEVELRDSYGRRVEFESMAFSNLNEIRELAETLGTRSSPALKNLPANAPEFIVSVTLRRVKFSPFAAAGALLQRPVRAYEH